jgi:hypothetical protein
MIPTKKTTDTSQTTEEGLLERPLAFLGGQIPLGMCHPKILVKFSVGLYATRHNAS